MAAEFKNRWNILWIGGTAASALALALLAGLARGQQTSGGRGEVVKIMEAYDPPFEAQIKTLLEAAKADMLPGGRLFLCTDTKLSTFSTNGALEMRAETPHCIYDSTLKTISSDQRLRVWTADGMIMEGYGFFFQLTNSDFTISNRVRTTIQGSLTNSFFR